MLGDLHILLIFKSKDMYQKTAKRSMIAISFFMFIINFLSFQVGISQSNPQLFFRDGVVINTDKEMMFISNKETIVEALELRSGKRIWRVKEEIN